MPDLRKLDGRTRRMIGCFIAIFAVNSIIAYALSNYIAARILMHEGAVAQDFLQSVVDAEGSRGKLFERPSGAALLSFGNHVRNLQGIVRVNVYSPDGFIRYSTESNFIERKFADNPELAEAFAGKMTVGLEEFSDDEKPEHLALVQGTGNQLIEAYLPMADTDGKKFAVVELYRKPESVLALIGSIRSLLWGAAWLGGGIVFFVLFWVMRRDQGDA
jgi:hypothetical protein